MNHLLVSLFSSQIAQAKRISYFIYVTSPGMSPPIGDALLQRGFKLHGDTERND